MLNARVKTVNLSTGRLNIKITRSDWPIEDLCGFASRHNNPARGYLFVSKVLGKHYPVQPKIMEKLYAVLSEKLLSLNMAGPVLIVALAETAIGLGHGIFEASQEKKTEDDWIFTHTTRYALNHPVALKLTESHCHAPDHLVYEPISDNGQRLFYGARTVVLVDDEMSTGNTLRNLALACAERMPDLELAVFVSIKCWLDDKSRESLARALPWPVEFVSLLDGSFEFNPYYSPVCPTKFRSIGNLEFKDAFLHQDYGRLGLTSMHWRNKVQPKRREILDSLRRGLELNENCPVLVLGTGEFIWQPYLLARFLEKEGFNVMFQSTTRTPISVGHDISQRLNFTDNYYDDIDNFLYNVSPESPSQKIVVYETRPLPEKHNLAEILNAQTVFF